MVSIFNIDDQVSGDVLKRNGWIWDDFDHVYRKCIYNRVIGRGNSCNDLQPDILNAVIAIDWSQYNIEQRVRYIFKIETCCLGCLPSMSYKGEYVSSMIAVNCLLQDLVDQSLELDIPIQYFNKTLVER